MRSDGWLLFLDGGGWRVAKGDGPACVVLTTEATAGAEPEGAAAAISQTLGAGGHRGESVVLGLDSDSCLAATFTANESPRAPSHTSLLYELEQWLPLAAEDVSADFVVHRSRVLGVAVQTAAIASLVDALETQGVHVQTISPLALLEVQAVCRVMGDALPDVVLWRHGERIELFYLIDGKPARWLSLPAEPAALRQNLKVLMLAHAGPLQVFVWQGSAWPLFPRADVVSHGDGSTGLAGRSQYSLADASACAAHEDLLGEALGDVEGIEWRETGDAEAGAEERRAPGEGDAVKAAWETAQRILAGQCSPWIELRRDGLAPRDPYRPLRGLLRLVAAAAAVLLMTLTCVFWYRGARYDAMADRYQREQMAVFEQALPGQRVPAGIRKRLESEYAKIAGLRGAASELPGAVSALTCLHRLLAGLPDSLPVRLLEIRLDRDRIDLLQGEVRSFGDHQRLMEALRARGFEIEPSPSENLPGGRGVSLRIVNARWRGMKDEG